MRKYLFISEKGIVHPLLLLTVLAVLVYFVVVTIAPFQNSFLSQIFPKPASQAAETWAFEETFNSGAPTSPSQSLLPKTFDYVITHRNHSANPNGPWKAMPMDHGADCKGANDPGPISGTNPILQHSDATTHVSDTANPDKSFYICNNHMMSAMGDVDGYSVSAFYPRQEFDFSSGNGVLEFDVSLNTNNRSWWEVMILPREKIQFGAAKSWLPISETYPSNSIILSWMNEARHVQIHNDKPAPDGIVIDQGDWRMWGEWVDKTDPALNDRRIRRKMKVTMTTNKISWDVQKADGTFDNYSVDVPQGLPLSKGVVMFKTHAYTPEKDGNMNEYTYHWDNLRFNGPRIAPFEGYEIPGLVLLNGNGSVPIGSTETVTLDLPKVGTNPVFIGQTQQGQPGQVLLSINDNPNIAIAPHSSSSKDSPCYFDGWRSFRVALDPSQLKVGQNTFKWTVGPRPSCAAGQWWWDGFAVKAQELQFDGVEGSGGPIPTTSPIATQVPTSVPNTPLPTAMPTIAPTPLPTIIPTPIPTPVPTVNPTPVPTAVSTGSVIKIYAAGTPSDGVYPTLRLDIKNSAISWKSVKSWTNVVGNVSNRTFVEYVYSYPTKVFSSSVRVRFTNDRYNPLSGQDRNLMVDRINIDGVDYQTERPTTYSQGSWDASNGCKAGIKQSEWLQCNGYFEYR